jgi:hypothetical protein
MNKEQQYTAEMFTAVQRVLDNHAALYTDFTAFTEHVREFSALLARIKEQSDNRDTVVTGKSDVRGDAKERLVKLAIDAKVKLLACARRKGFTEARVLADVSNYLVSAMKEGELRAFAANLAAEAERRLADLEGYRFGQADLGALRQATANFEHAVADRDVSMASRQALTADLDGLFREAYRVLREGLDTLMTSFRHDQPEFFTTYKAARVIRRRGIRHNAPPTPPATPPPAPAQ